MISPGRWCHMIWILTDELILEQIRNMLFLTCSSVNWCINIYISHGTMKKVPYVGLYTDYIYMYGLVISFDYSLIILYVERNGVGLHLTVTLNVYGSKMCYHLREIVSNLRFARTRTSMALTQESFHYPPWPDYDRHRFFSICTLHLLSDESPYFMLDTHDIWWSIGYM